MGTYNPDWVVLIEIDGKEKLYFVVETKGNIMFDSLRQVEREKIRCGKKYFEALGNELVFKEDDNVDEFMEENVVV